MKAKWVPINRLPMVNNVTYFVVLTIFVSIEWVVSQMAAVLIRVF